MQKYCYSCMRPLGDSPVCASCGCDSRTAAAPAPYFLRPGSTLSGRYLIGRAIGEGGFGITYIGLDVTLSKRVAIKEFFPSGAANRTTETSENVIVTQGKEQFFIKGVERFLQEAKNVAAFSDEEGIVDVLDYFQANGTAYIVMEYLDGQTLKQCVIKRGCFKPEALIRLMTPIMRSLGYMHSKGIIHRDISPDNIMYTKRGKLKLMDFGSARYFTNEEREMSVILKQGFAPEEQYRQNGKQGPFTDVYALCATIYSCITGKVPVGSLDRLVNDTLQPPSRLGVRIQPHQERALMHGLAVNPQNRTQDMTTLMREFSEPPAAPYRPPVQNYQNINIYPNNPNMQGFQPQGQPVTSDPAEPQKKKSKAPIIIAAVAAVLLIGGGIVAAITIFGGNKSGGGSSSSNPSSISSSSSVISSQASPQQSVESSQQSSRSSGDDQSSLNSQTSQDSSSQSSDESSQQPSSQPSSLPSGNHEIRNNSGEFIISDDRINTDDPEAEEKLYTYLEDTDTESTSEILDFNYYVLGNTVVYEYRYLIDLTPEQINALKTSVANLISSSQNVVTGIRAGSGVSDAQIVYAYLNTSGGLLVSGICDDK